LLIKHQEQGPLALLVVLRANQLFQSLLATAC
jgi:hypothetical protein